MIVSKWSSDEDDPLSLYDIKLMTRLCTGTTATRKALA